MLRRFFISSGWLLVLFVWVLPGMAQQAPPMFLSEESSVSLMEEGQDALWDLRFDEAQRLFEELQHRPDGAIAGAYHLSYLALFNALFTDSRSTFDVYYTRSDALFEALEEVSNSPWKRYLEAEAHLHRAMAGAKTGRQVRAALAARTAYNKYNSCIEEAPELYDAYAGTGVFNIIIGSLPSRYQRLLGILGYRGSVSDGLDQLALAAEKSAYAKHQAQTILALTDVMLNGSAGGGVDILKALHEENPESSLFSYLYGFALVSNRQAALAEEKLQSAFDAGTSAAYFFVDYAEFYLAQSQFQQHKLEAAVGHYQHYIHRHQGEALKAVAHLELGLSLELLGRREEALAYYEQVSSERAFDSDQAARRLARRRLVAPMTESEQQLLRGRNAFDAGENDSALTFLFPVFEEGGRNQRAEAAYRLGRVYHTMEDAEAAIRYYQAAIDEPSSDPLDRWAPWGQFYIAELHAEAGRLDEAREGYHAALSYANAYDYHLALEQQAKLRLEKLPS